MNQRVVVLTDDEIEGGRALLKQVLGNGILRAQLGGPIDDALPEWLVSLTEKFQHPEGITDEQVGNAINELSGHDAGSERSWIEVRQALRAAFFPGDGA